MVDQKGSVLEEAIARNAGIVLSFPSAGMLRHYKSRFLGADPEGFWVEAPPAEEALINQLMADRQPAGISFRSGVHKVMFGSPVLRFDPETRINTQIVAPGLLLSLPENVKIIQRRNNYRVGVNAEEPISIRIWRIARWAQLRDRPTAAQQVKASFRDLSIGGAGVLLCGEEGQPPKISSQDRLRIELVIGDETLLIEGRLRYPETPGEEPTQRAGIQFNVRENELDGRKALATLTRLIGELQRAEIRRLRVGMTRMP